MIKYIKSAVYILLSGMILLMDTNRSLGQQAGFSGNWRINSAKSALNGNEPWVVPTGFITKIQPATLQMIRLITNSKGKSYQDTLNLSLDGKPLETVTRIPTKQTATLVYSVGQKGLTLTLHSTYMDGKPYLDATEAWSLAADGETLTVHREVTQYNGLQLQVDAVYDKQ